jgi:LysM repeat protein
MLISVEKQIKSLVIATSVVAVSACSNMPHVDMGGVGESVGNTVSSVSEKTLEFGSKAYQSTRRFLGYDREPRDGDLMDEVDLALMEDDAAPEADDSGVNVIIQPVAIAAPNNLEPLPSEEPALEPMQQVAIQEYVHEVQAGESLWTIAKATTGDATNWKILAEVNNMPDGTSVFPTQKLVVPADMVKPELAGLGFVEPISDDLDGVEAASATQFSDNELMVIEDTGDETQQSHRLPLPDLELTAANPLDEPAASIAKIDSTENAVPVTVEAGETLWNLAKRTTGDATNWQTIATHNNFSEKEAVFVRYGQTIYIPTELAKDEVLAAAGVPAVQSQPGADTEVIAAASNTSAEKPDAPLPAGSEVVAAAEPSVKSEAVDASANVITDASLFDETKPIKIVEAKFQAEENTDVIPNASATSTSDAGELQTIMVSGTYYPKAIYNEADFSSSLLQRVSPGTELVVSKSMGSWFEVRTEKGIGYMHARDIK